MVLVGEPTNSGDHPNDLLQELDGSQWFLTRDSRYQSNPGSQEIDRPHDLVAHLSERANR
jgi:hypothetical protein